MANIVVNEVSQNYTYNIGNNSYATVALPIAASWGPGYFPAADGSDAADVLTSTAWRRYPATQTGMEAFVADYRSPESFYKSAKDFSYYHALTYLSSGYDVLVCRVGCGCKASLTYIFRSGGGSGNPTPFLTVRAKYPGSFGNSVAVELTSKYRLDSNGEEWPYVNAIVYTVDAAGYRTAVENLVFAGTIEDSTDTIPFIDDVESNFVDFVVLDYGILEFACDLFEHSYGNSGITPSGFIHLSGGSDFYTAGSTITNTTVVNLARDRFAAVGYSRTGSFAESYAGVLNSAFVAASTASNYDRMLVLAAREYHYLYAIQVMSLLSDKLAYRPNRIVSPGWDDIDIAFLDRTDPADIDNAQLYFADVTPLHTALLDAAYLSRCGTAYIDIPRALPKSAVYNESTQDPGYAQKLSRYQSAKVPISDSNGALYSTHSALFAPWGQFRFTGTGRNNTASPAFIGLMLERAMILNQPDQYEWVLPNNRKQNVQVGKLDYTLSKKYLDMWQSLEGVGINVITNIPGLGLSLWGNSTLYEVPEGTYQALANLSTRKLFNAVEDLVYKVGIGITFAYNNEQAYSKFYAGVTPLLDTMKNVGAIDDYYVKMAADINGLDQVNANTVVGKIYLTVNGVVNDVIVDLIALPPGADLSVLA